MKDIKKIAEEYRNKNGNDKITTKELLWFMISKFDGLEERVTKTETRQNLFMWAIPVSIGITTIIFRII